MNRIKILMVLLTSGLITFGFVSYQPDGPVAIVKKIINDVKYKSGEQGDWTNAKVSQTLIDHDEIKTGNKSLAIILFTDGSGQLRVRENAVLQIFGQKENKQLNKNTVIQNGSVSFEVNKQADEEFKFTTPTAVASIRGTGGLLNANSDSTQVILEHGAMELNSLLQGGERGNIIGGQTGTVYRDGKFVFRNSTANDLKLLQAAKNINTKKVRVKVNNQVLEIEYLSQ